MDQNTSTPTDKRVVALGLPERNFNRLFDRGMDLVEEASLYLDGEGRESAKDLSRDLAAQYGSQAMALTTRLMRIASWLLIHRSLLEGELDTDQAEREKMTLRLDKLPVPRNSPAYVSLPREMHDLIDRSLDMQTALLAFSRAKNGETVEATENAVATQHSLLRTAFQV